MSLSTILRRGVGLQLEVMTEPSAGALAETLVAFANGDGGTVLLGALPDGQVTGDLQVEDAESLLRAAQVQCRPLVRATGRRLRIVRAGRWRSTCRAAPSSTPWPTAACSSAPTRATSRWMGGRSSTWPRPRPAATMRWSPWRARPAPTWTMRSSRISSSGASPTWAVTWARPRMSCCAPSAR